jgi:hypothetical protein
MANSFQAFNRLAAEADEPDHSVALQGHKNGEALSLALAAMKGALPGCDLTITDTMTGQDHIAVRFAVDASRNGNERAPAEGILIYRVAEGRIAEHWLQPGVPALVQAPSSAPVQA